MVLGFGFAGGLVMTKREKKRREAQRMKDASSEFIPKKKSDVKSENHYVDDMISITQPGAWSPGSIFFPLWGKSNESTIENPDITNEGEFTGKYAKKKEYQVEVDNGYDYFMEEYLEWAGRPIIVNGRKI